MGCAISRRGLEHQRLQTHRYQLNVPPSPRLILFPGISGAYFDLPLVAGQFWPSWCRPCRHRAAAWLLALCLFGGVGLSACFKPAPIARSNFKLLSSITLVVFLQGKSMKNTTDIYVMSMGWFFFSFLFKASPQNHFS